MLLIISLLFVILLFSWSGQNYSQVDSQQYSDLLTCHTWRNSYIGSITYDSDGTWTTKSLYGGRSGYWTISGDTLCESNRDEKEWSYNYITDITDQDVEAAMNPTMMQDIWKSQWYVSD